MVQPMVHSTGFIGNFGWNNRGATSAYTEGVEMTERDELVERVGSAISRALKDGEQFEGAARAAIAEYEAATERAAVSLTDMFDERRVKLEAEAAAMRKVLHDGVPHITKNCCCEPKGAGTCWWCCAYSALLPDAGQKVLAVVRAAEDALDVYETIENGGTVRIIMFKNGKAIPLAGALRALGWKP